MGLFHVQAVVRLLLCSTANLNRSIIYMQYNAVSLIFSWFSLGNVWLMFSIMLDSVADSAPRQHAVVVSPLLMVELIGLTVQRSEQHATC